MRGATTVLSALMVVIGLALLARAVAEGDALVFRMLLGLLFVAAGAGRLYAERRR
jgi:ascorbate-specific PTS system EIIC-type component UlaA